MRILLLLVIVVVVGLAGHFGVPFFGEVPTEPTENRLQWAFEQQQSGIHVESSGEVYRVLEDDTRGIQHQRFLLHTASGQSLLIAHNIDLAPRLPNLKVGDRVGFSGEYIYNDKGGLVHWTHRDPQGRHIDGWLEFKGRRYQ